MSFYFNQIIHGSLTQTTPPASEPITLAVAKNQCRIDSDITTDDALVTSLIVAARQYCEAYLNRPIITQSWQYCEDIFPFFRSWALIGSPIVLPLPTVQSVESVQYIDSANTLQTFNSDLYVADLKSTPARLTPAYGQTWPISSLYVPNAVQVNFTCGYGLPTDDPATIPQTVIQAMLMLIAHWYITRESASEQKLNAVPMGVQNLLNCERLEVYV